MTALFVCLAILILAVVILTVSIHRDRKEKKAQKPVEDERSKISKEVNRIYNSPVSADLVEIQETQVSQDVPLPRDKRNIYYLGIGLVLDGTVSKMIQKRLEDSGLCFVDLNLMMRVHAHTVKYVCPASRDDIESPDVLVKRLRNQFFGNGYHGYMFRYDLVKGFMCVDIAGEDRLSLARNIMSYIAYADCGFKAPGDDYKFSMLAPKSGTSTGGSNMTSGENSTGGTVKPAPAPRPKKDDDDSGVRFSVREDSGVRFRVTGGSPSFGSGVDLDQLFSQMRQSSAERKPAAKPKIKTPDQVLAQMWQSEVGRKSVAQPHPKTQEQMLSEETKRMLAETLDNIQKLQLNGVPLSMLQALIGKTTRLSEMRVDKRYRIFLTDFGNIEIKLNPLQTTVYILFLNHPEGISFYDLRDYKQEIMDIYGNLTGRGDLKAIEKSVSSLVDRFSDAISVQISRIRRAFILAVSDDIAKNYYIDGPQGGAKTISLPRSYVRREDLGRSSVSFDSPVAVKGREFMDAIRGANFRSFGDLSFLLRTCDHMEFRHGYVPDAFWCGTKEDRYLRLYACLDGSDKRYPVASSGSEPVPYDDTMFLEGIYSEEQSKTVPRLNKYMKATDSLGVWEAYLLSQCETMLPHPQESRSECRRYIMSHRDLVESLGEKQAQSLCRRREIVPEVKMEGEKSATISCCYVSSERSGLCRDIIRAEIGEDSVSFIVKSRETIS